MQQYKINKIPIPEKYTKGKLFVEDSMGRSAGKTILIPLSIKGLLFNVSFPIFVVSIILIPLLILKDKDFIIQATTFTGVVLFIITPVVVLVDVKYVLKPRKLYFRKVKQLNKDQKEKQFKQLNSDGNVPLLKIYDENGSTIAYWINKIESLDNQK